MWEFQRDHYVITDFKFQQGVYEVVQATTATLQSPRIVTELPYSEVSKSHADKVRVQKHF